MTLKPELYDHYWQHGWVVVENVFTPEEAEAAAQKALSICLAELAVEDEGQISHKIDRAEDGAVAPRKLDQPFLKDDVFQALALDSRLTTLLCSFLDGRKPLLARDQILMKPPQFGSAKPYHQDNFYFRMQPADQVITAWIAMDDVDERNGCLRYISGSHQGGLVPHEPIPGEPFNLVPPPDQIDLHKEAVAPVGKGGVVFHHGQILHTSHRNESERWRRGYATHWVTSEVTSESNTLDGAYFLREDYPR
ncbi:MAG: phytanoyl-CoA dioxygenase family protein [Chloroflexota bacterium]